MLMMRMSVISWIPLRQISSDEVFESYLAILLILVCTLIGDGNEIWVMMSDGRDRQVGHGAIG